MTVNYNELFLENLPKELQELILSYLDDKSLIDIASVNKVWHSLSRRLIFNRYSKIRFLFQDHLLEHAISTGCTIPVLKRIKQSAAEFNIQKPMPFKTRILLVTYYLQQGILLDLPIKVKRILTRMDARDNLPLATNLILALRKRDCITEDNFTSFVDELFKQDSMNIDICKAIIPHCNHKQLEQKFLGVLLSNFFANMSDIPNNELNIFTRKLGIEIFSSEKLMLKYIYNLCGQHQVCVNKALSIFYLKHNYTVKEADYHILKLIDVAGEESNLNWVLTKIFPFASKRTKKLVFNRILDSLIAADVASAEHKFLLERLTYLFSHMEGVLSPDDIQSIFERLLKSEVFASNSDTLLLKLFNILDNFNNANPLVLEPELEDRFVFLIDKYGDFGLSFGFKLLLNNLPVAHKISQDLYKVIGNHFECFHGEKRSYALVELFFRLLPDFTTQQRMNLIFAIKKRVDDAKMWFFTYASNFFVEFSANQEINIKNIENIFGYLFSNNEERARMLPNVLGDKIDDFYSYLYKKSTEMSNKHIGYSSCILLMSQIFTKSNSEFKAKFFDLVLSSINQAPYSYYGMLDLFPRNILLQEDFTRAIVANIKPYDVDETTTFANTLADILGDIKIELLIKLLPELKEKMQDHPGLRNRFYKLLVDKTLCSIVDYDVITAVGRISVLDKNLVVALNYVIGYNLISYPVLIKNNKDNKTNLSCMGYITRRLEPNVQQKILNSIKELSIETRLDDEKFCLSVATVYASIFKGLKQTPASKFFDYIIILLKSDNLELKFKALKLIDGLGDVLSQQQMTQFMTADWGMEYHNNRKLYRELTRTIMVIFNSNGSRTLKFQPEYFDIILSKFPGNNEILYYCIDEYIRRNPDANYCVVKDKIIQYLPSADPGRSRLHILDNFLIRMYDIMTFEEMLGFVAEFKKIFVDLQPRPNVGLCDKLLHFLVKLVDSPEFATGLDAKTRLQLFKLFTEMIGEFNLEQCSKTIHILENMLIHLEPNYVTHVASFVKPIIQRFSEDKKTTLMTFFLPEMKAEEISIIEHQGPKAIRLNFLA